MTMKHGNARYIKLYSKCDVKTVNIKNAVRVRLMDVRFLNVVDPYPSLKHMFQNGFKSDPYC